VYCDAIETDAYLNVMISCTLSYHLTISSYPCHSYLHPQLLTCTHHLRLLAWVHTCQHQRLISLAPLDHLVLRGCQVRNLSIIVVVKVYIEFLTVVVLGSWV
jgi:hypothetical protein